MHRIRLVLCGLVALSAPLHGQSVAPTAPPAVRESIDSLVIAVRDMAAGAIVTPAAHIPVGGLLDSTGYVASVVSTGDGRTIATDSVLVPFRLLLANAARRQRMRGVGLGYLVTQPLPGRSAPVSAVRVEVEHVSGYRADLLFPYTRNEFGEPVFGDVATLPASLRVFPERKPANNSRRAP